MPIGDNKNRLQWLDIAKGITIILMVMGHSALPNVLGRFIFAFHMPLFFIASGITTKYPSFLDFVKKKSKGLLLPFFIYSIIVLVLEAILTDTSMGEEFANWLKLGWLGMALWFVPVLYLSLIVCWLINKLSNRWIKVGVLVLLLINSTFLCYNKIWLPWNISTVPYATFFIFLGSWLKQYCKYIDILFKRWYIYIILFTITFLISYYWRLDMAWNKCVPIIPLSVGALSGSLLVFCVSRLFESSCNVISNIIAAIGKETFVILAFSQIIIRYIHEYFTMPFYVKYFILAIVLMLIVSLKNMCINRFKVL